MKDIKISNIPLKYYIPLFLILIIGMITNNLGNDVISLFMFIYLFSGLLFYIGSIIPIFGKYMGGSLILPLIGGSTLVYFNLVSDEMINMITQYVSSGFFTLVLGTVIVGAILNLDRTSLIQTSIRLIPAILFTQLIAILFLVIACLVTGTPILDGIYMTGIPQFCGGSSGGVVALPEMYSSLFGKSIAYYAGRFIVYLNVANMICILFASIINLIGKKHPTLTGNGHLLPLDNVENIDIKSHDDEKIIDKDSGSLISKGLIITCGVFILSRIISNFIPQLNYIVWATLISILIKILNIDDADMRKSTNESQNFMIFTFMPSIILSIGITTVDLHDFVSLLSPTNLFIIAMGVLGSVIGALLISKITKMYPVDSMIGIGCCAPTLGMSGVLTVLSATNRLKLMPYSLIVSRFGGALMLVIINLTIIFFI